MTLNTEPYTVCYPADFYEHLLLMTEGRMETGDGFLVYKNDDLALQYEIRRLIFAPGFELSFCQYSVKDDLFINYNLTYDGIEILAFFDNDFSQPISIGYHLRFPNYSHNSQKYTMLLSKGSCLCVNLYLDKVWLQEHIMMDRFQHSQCEGWQELEGEALTTFLSVITQLKDYTFQGDSQRVFFRAKAMELFSYVLAFMDANKQQIPYPTVNLTHNDISSLHRAREIVEQNYNNPPPIPHIARLVYMNANKLMQGYKQLFGMTVYNHIITCRMKHALNLLEVKNLTVGEVAQEVGYAHQGHFIKAFKKFYGITPGDLKHFSRTRKE